MSSTLKVILPPALRVVLLVAFLNLMLLGMSSSDPEFPDTQSYILAFDDIAHHGFSVERLPVYPLILAVACKVCGMAHYVGWVIALQMAAFLISVVALWHLAYALGKSVNAALFPTLFYAFVPGISTLTCALLTDSLATSITVVMLYALWRVWSNPSRKWMWTFCLLLITLLMLRPACLALLPGVGMMCVVGLIKKRRGAGWMTLAAVAALVPVGIQTLAVKSTTGVLTPSVVSVYNRLFIATQQPADTVSIYEYPTFFPTISDWAPIYRTVDSLGYEGALSQIDAEIGPFYGLSGRFERTLTDEGLIFSPESYPEKFPVAATFYAYFGMRLLPFWLIYVALVCSAVVMLVRIRRGTSWFDLCLWLVVAFFTAMVLLAAPYDFDRLILPAIPALLLIVMRTIKLYPPI